MEAKHEQSDTLTAENAASRNWSDGGENGDYQNQCLCCSELFFGHKRRVVCRRCFTNSPDVQTVLKAATSAAEQALRAELDEARHNAENLSDEVDRLQAIASAARDTEAKLAAAEQAKAQAEQELQICISAVELLGMERVKIATDSPTPRMWVNKRADQAEQRAQAAEADVAAFLEWMKTQQGWEGFWADGFLGEKPVSKAKQNLQAIRRFLEESGRRLKFLAERDRLTRELAEAREALRAALIPLAVLKMGQQTKPYAEHTATLTAEIAWAHDAVYAALLKDRRGVISRPAIGAKIHFRGGCGRTIPAEVVGYDDEDPLSLYIDYRMDNGEIFHRAIIFTYNLVTSEAKA